MSAMPCRQCLEMSCTVIQCQAIFFIFFSCNVIQCIKDIFIQAMLITLFSVMQFLFYCSCNFIQGSSLSCKQLTDRKLCSSQTRLRGMQSLYIYSIYKYINIYRHYYSMSENIVQCHALLSMQDRQQYSMSDNIIQCLATIFNV